VQVAYSDIRARQAPPDKIGIRTLGVPEEFGGTPLDRKNEAQKRPVSRVM